MKCIVCGQTDARALCSIELAREAVVVCGTHALIHRRAVPKAESARELRAIVRDRRETRRRMPIPDELGAKLIEAFSAPSERRASGDRRR